MDIHEVRLRSIMVISVCIQMGTSSSATGQRVCLRDSVFHVDLWVFGQMRGAKTRVSRFGPGLNPTRIGA